MSSRLVIVGGFLGAGKTTLILRVAQMLRAQGISPAIITNDQGNDLVDTAQATLRGIPVAEVPAGCFCCRFDALITAAGRLEQEASPQVILAEPVGSCTDLAATVVLPLERMYQTRFTLAPLTIAADARRLLDFVRQDGVRALHDDITYLFAKQIEEAELLLLNKCDLLPVPGLTFLRNWLLAYLPGVQVLPVSGRTGEGLAAWVERFLDPPTSQAQPHQVLDLDYTRYGRAEARLVWLNASGILGGDAAALAQDWADGVLAALVTGLEAAALPIAHVKLMLEQATDGEFDQAIKASVTGPVPAVISWDTRDTALNATGTRWILNARIDTSPDRLEKLVDTILGRTYAGIQAIIETHTCFQPAPPQPQHRYPAGATPPIFGIE